MRVHRLRNLGVFVAALLVLTATACARRGAETPPAPGGAGGGGAVSGKVTAAGSTALLPLVQQAAEEFMQKNPGVTVNVSGGGSFTGLTQVAAGSVDIGNSDVDLPPELQGKNLVDHRVAVAPFVLVTHPGVGVTNLTKEQAKGIFTGKITNWREVGGPDQAITVVDRPRSSGSRATIQRIVLDGAEVTDRAVVQDSNGKVRATVASTPGSIGYIDAAYLDPSVKAVAFEGVAYSADAVISGKYPIFAYEHMFTRGEPAGATRAFIDYILSPDFQERVLPKMGFIPVSKMSR